MNSTLMSSAPAPAPTASSPQPIANLAAIAPRARLYQQIREFFALRQVTEVETPLLWPVQDQTTAALGSISASFCTVNQPQTAHLARSAHPAMQHLLMQGAGAIYQIAKAFRDIDPDRKHQREFTLLTWYRPDFQALQAMQEISDLLSILFASQVEPKILSYKQAFMLRLDINPLGTDIKTLKDSARRVGLIVDLGQNRAAWRKLLFSQMIEPTLGMDYPVYLTDLPNDADSLAEDAAATSLKLNDEGNPIQAGFDLYLDGLKIASAHEQSIDGLQCIRVTVGLDHLLMVLLNTRRMDKVQALAGIEV